MDKEDSLIRNLIFILFKVNSLIQDNELENNLYNPNDDLNSNEKKDEYKNIINNLMKGFNNYLRDDNIDKWIAAINKKMPRVDNVKKVIENGYDIKTSADNLYNEYLKLLK